jgi:hypothetical protein
MDIQKTIETARALLQQGDTGAALSTLTTFLQGRPAQSDNLRALQVLESQYNNVRQRQIKGLASAEETQRAYNNINDSLYAVMEAIMQGKAVGGIAPKRPKILIWAGIALVAALAGGGIWFFLSDSSLPGCPDFSKERPRILILPFKNLGLSNDAKVATSIKERIDNISEKNKFPLSAKVYNAYSIEENDPDRDEAQTIRQHCNCNMVVWGFYQKKDSVLELDARFITGQESGRTEIVRFNDLFQVAEKQELRSLDDAVFSLCAQLAYAMNRDTLVVKWMNKIQKKAGHDVELQKKMQ